MKATLISLAEHNGLIASLTHDPHGNEPKPNGVACPRCKKELHDIAPNMILNSNPPKKAIRCTHCGWDGYRLA